MDLLKMGGDLLSQKLGLGEAGAEGGNIVEMLSQLMSNADGSFDLNSIVSSLQENGLGEIVNSWLGDGENLPIDAESIQNLFGAEKIQALASQMGSDENGLLSNLQEALPKIVDASSSGGDLLANLDSLGGISDFAKKLF